MPHILVITINQLTEDTDVANRENYESFKNITKYAVASLF